MRIPQELVAIIGELDISEQRNFENEATLKSCALVARSFVRPSQARLFARTIAHDHTRIEPSTSYQSGTVPSQRLATILSTSPHITGYIRILDVDHNPTADFVRQILVAVTAPHTLILADNPGSPFSIDASIIGVFSLPSLQCGELCRYQFEDTAELESLDLTLRAVYFPGFVRPINMGNPGSSAASEVALEQLSLVEAQRQDVDLMLDLFATVDIRHLKSLSLADTDITRLLYANARSLRTLKLGQARYSQASESIRLIHSRRISPNLCVTVYEMSRIGR